MRDASRRDKTDFLLAMNHLGAGSVEIFAADLLQATGGAYDEVCAGCSAVFHVAADLHTDAAYGEGSAQRTYDAIMDGTRGVLESCRKAGSVKRVVYTSSCAAVWSGWRGGADPSGYEFTEQDWGGHGTAAHLWNVEKASSAGQPGQPRGDSAAAFRARMRVCARARILACASAVPSCMLPNSLSRNMSSSDA